MTCGASFSVLTLPVDLFDLFLITRLGKSCDLKSNGAMTSDLATKKYVFLNQQQFTTMLVEDVCFYDLSRCSMYGLFTYIWVVLGVNVGKYTSPIEHLGWDVQQDSFCLIVESTSYPKTGPAGSPENAFGFQVRNLLAVVAPMFSGEPCSFSGGSILDIIYIIGCLYQ